MAYVENKTDYPACLKNSVKFFVAYIYKMNVYVWFPTCVHFLSAGL